MYKLFMSFENPTERVFGKRRSVQGFAVYGDLGFVLFHGGYCGVYSLLTKSEEPLGVFPLGSLNLGEPDHRYANHANDAVFGHTLAGEKFPLLYVTAGNSGDTDERGYLAYCAVEQIREENGVFTASTIQRIYYKNDGIKNTEFVTPCWGWPASLVDTESNSYYFVSAKYRTKKEFSRPDNAYIITRFDLPSPSVGDVTLTPKDIRDQFSLPFNTYLTQGGTVRDGRIWYMFGTGTNDYPNHMNVINLREKKYELTEDLSSAPFADEEVECCAFYGDRLLINTQKNRIYERILL